MVPGKHSTTVSTRGHRSSRKGCSSRRAASSKPSGTDGNPGCNPLPGRHRLVDALDRARRILSLGRGIALVLLLFALTACEEAVEPDPPPPKTAAPKAVTPIADVSLTLGGPSAITAINVAGNFNDPDNQTLTYAAKSSAPAVATASVAGSTVT